MRARTFATIATVSSVLACEGTVAEVRRYAGVPVSYSVALAKGDVVVTNRNGSVSVDTGGATGRVLVSARPFATGADDDAAAAEAVASLSTLTLTAAADGQGGVAVNGGGDDAHGFDLAVHLPYPFGGLLTITSTNGAVHYVGSSGGRGATINVATGDIFVQDGGKALVIQGGRSDIRVVTLPTITGTRVTTSDGDIVMQIPDAANLLITATTASGGTVTPPPNRSVEDGSGSDDSSGDDDDTSSRALATVAPDHMSATIQLGSLQTIQSLNQSLTVSTGRGNIVFR